jgi:hypothetical protein
MKLTHNHYRTPYDQCSCWAGDECFRCSVMRVHRERHKRIEVGLLILYWLVIAGVNMWRIGFNAGWW